MEGVPVQGRMIRKKDRKGRKVNSRRGKGTTKGKKTKRGRGRARLKIHEREKVKVIKQLRQMKTQTLRCLREASSPEARMALMKSNKWFKPGD